MLDLQTLPTWVQENAKVEEGYLRFNTFAKVKFFLLDKQVTPYGSIEFPDEMKDRMIVPEDDAMVINGFMVTDLSNPKHFRLRTNSNDEYDVRYLTDAAVMESEVDGDDITLTMVGEGTTPIGDPATKMVVSPLSTEELRVVTASEEDD
jgi:hypothetical protein